jgi:hypothetical protein
MTPLVATDDIITAASRTRMQTVTSLSEAKGEPYGLGMQILERGDRDVFGHVGTTAGFHGSALVDRERGTCVAIGTNDLTAVYDALDVPVWDVIDEYLGR